MSRLLPGSSLAEGLTDIVEGDDDDGDDGDYDDYDDYDEDHEDHDNDVHEHQQ